MEYIHKISELLGPVASSALGHALIGLVILLVGLFLVSFINNILKSLLSKLSFLKQNDLVKPIAALTKAVLTIFVLIAVLQHFGLTGVLQPLENLANQFLSAIPNIIGAGVVAYAGWIIAKIVSELVGSGLQKFDAQIASKIGSQDIKVSKFGSAFIFGGILLPIVVAALGVLNIPAITIPASNMINELMSSVPNIVGAGIILLVTYFVAKFVIFILSGLLDGMNVNALPLKLGITNVFSERFTLINLTGSAIMFFAMLTASVAAVDTLGIEVVSHIFSKVLEFGGGVLVGSLILVIGNFLGNLAHQKISASGNNALASIARMAILGLVLAMGLKSMGLADNIVNMAFGFTIGSAAVAFALAFGLGGRDAAKTVSEKWVSKLK